MEKRINIPGGTTLEEAINLLLAEKEKGERAYCIFNGHEFHSDNVTVDSAYLEVHGKTKKEFDYDIKKWLSQKQKQKKLQALKEEEYEMRVANDRKINGEHPIDEESVIAGLKFIAEHQDLEQEELITGLLELGCNYSLNTIKEQQPKVLSISDGIKEGDLFSGASIIANMRDSEIGRDYGVSWFLDSDNENSIYNFIRVLTNDPSYTKERVLEESHGIHK